MRFAPLAVLAALVFAPVRPPLALAGPAPAGDALPALRSSRPVVSLRMGEQFRPDAWRLAPEVRPDVLEVPVEPGRAVRVVFLSDVDSLGFDVAVGGSFDFVIEHGDDRCWTRIVGIRRVPMAVFDSTYRAAHRGHITVESPECYELVNVALALTSTGIADSNLVFHRSAYYRDLRAWFDPYRTHPAIVALDSVLRVQPNAYHPLKMNGYSFEFDARGRIVQSPVYDRTGFSGQTGNALRPFVPLLQSFADASRFREFHRRHRDVYARQVAFFTDTASVRGMLDWLERQFPEVRPYDSFKIVFSPLVAYNQSATWMEDRGFRELQAHVNHPYPQDAARWRARVPLSPAATVLLRSEIVFTELNHGFINPFADTFGDHAERAVRDRARWVDPARDADYYPGAAAFNEYMNWALVSLWVTDVAPAGEDAPLIEIVDRMMTRTRGFTRFAEFDAFLVDLYRRRAPGATVASLYPRIFEWFERQTAAPPAGPPGDR